MTHLSGGADLDLSPSFVSLHTLLICFLFAPQTAVHVRVGHGDTRPAWGWWHRDSRGGGSPTRGRTLQKLKLRQPLLPQRLSRYTHKYWLNRHVLSKSDSPAQRCMTKVGLKKKGNQGNCR